MDFEENTRKFAENLKTVQENRAQLEEGQKQYEDYIKQLKENLQKVQSSRCQTKSILEGNNFTKTIFNENCQVMKELFGKIYKCTQEIDENVSKINEEVGPLEEHYDENEKQFRALLEKKDDKIRILEVMGNNTIEKLMQENFELQQKLAQLKAEFPELNESWKGIIDEQEEKNQALQSIMLQNEILIDQIESQQKEEDKLLAVIESERQESQKKLEDITNEVETIENEITKHEKCKAEILQQQLKQQLKLKEELMHQEQEELMVLQKLEKNRSDLENRIAETKDKSAKEIQELTAMIESKTKLNEENLIELQAVKDKSHEINMEIDELRLKNTALDEEIDTFTSHHEESNIIQTETSKEIEKIKTENNQLEKECEKFNDNILYYKKQIFRKEKDLEESRLISQLALMEINDELNELESDFSTRKTELEKEVQENNLKKKQLQQKIEQMKRYLEDLKIQQVRSTIQKGQYQQKLLGIGNQYRAISNEITQYEAAIKARNIKLIPRPPLKRACPHPTPMKLIRHFESDSSIDDDGEVRDSYAEFMAKKRMKEAKKLKD